MSLKKPLDITIKDLDGVDRVYRIGRFATVDGFKIIARVPSNLATLSKQLPHLDELLLQMCKYVAVDVPTNDGGTHEIILSTQALIDNHVPDSESLLRLLFELMRHNTSFFGRADQSILDFLVERLAALYPKAILMFTQLSQQLSANDTQP